MDNIVAIATASGYAGIGVVRISGTELLRLAEQITCMNSEACPIKFTHKVVQYCNFYAADGSIIDTGLLLYFKAPYSFTGEDVIELHGHGSPVGLQMLVKRCVELGGRHAEAGEFSRRAYLNGKMDLLQAESIIDLIHAESESSAKGAVRSLSGTFSKHIHVVNQQLIDLRMFVEASIDFPEEDIEFIANAKIKNKLDAVQIEIKKLLKSTRQGVLLNHGANVVIIGRPNVGKSSILNVLANEDVAIVTDIAGTTRDIIKEKVIINGILFNIIDTAGIRDTDDEVEQIGIARALKALNTADLCLVIIDATVGITSEDEAILMQVPAHIPRIFVHNKIDLAPPVIASGAKQFTRSSSDNNNHHIEISAKNNLGIDKLRDAMLTAVGYDNKSQDVFIARERHLDAMQHAVTHIDYGFNNWHNLELLAEELRYAHNQLSTITGEFTSDDLLGEIFSKFCIGK